MECLPPAVNPYNWRSKEHPEKIQAMRHTTRNLRNRIRLQKIGKKLRREAKQQRKQQRAATK